MPGNKWDILQEVITRIEAMNIVGGYLRDIGKVYLARRIEEDIPNTQKPAVAVIVGSEQSIDLVGLKTTDFMLSFTFQIFTAGDEDDDSIHQVLDISEDIAKAMLTANFFVGDAYDATHLQTGAPVVYPIDDKHATGVIAFQITRRDNYHI